MHNKVIVPYFVTKKRELYTTITKNNKNYFNQQLKQLNPTTIPWGHNTPPRQGVHFYDNDCQLENVRRIEVIRLLGDKANQLN